MLLFPSSTAKQKRKRFLLEQPLYPEMQLSTPNVTVVRGSRTEMTRTINCIPTDILSSARYSTLSMLPGFGDILAVYRNSLEFYSNIHQDNEFGSSIGPALNSIICDNGASMSQLVSMEKNHDDEKTIVICSEGGDIMIAALRNNVLSGISDICRQKIMLADGEKITSIKFYSARNVAILGTNLESTYIVKRIGSNEESSDIFAYKLEKSQQNIFMGLLQTGAKIFGLTFGARAAGLHHFSSVIRSIPFTVESFRDSFLMVASESNIFLWSNWLNMGEEDLIFEYSLRSLLAYGLPEGQVLVIDVQAVIPESASDLIQVFILFSHTDSMNTDKDQLWIASLSFKVADSQTSTNHLVCDCKFFITSDFITNREGLSKCPIRPKLHTLLSDTSLLVSWISRQTQSLSCSILDVSSVVASSGDSSSSTCQGWVSSCSENLCNEDTGIHCNDIVGAEVIQTGATLAILKRNGELYSSSPPVVAISPAAVPTALSADHSNKVKISQSRFHLSEGMNQQEVIWALVTGEFEASAVPEHILQGLRSLSLRDKETLILTISESIIDRFPISQDVQLIHDLVNEKLALHTRLLIVLDAIDFFGQSKSRDDQALDSSDMRVKLLSSHQLLVASQGLSFAVRETLERTEAIASDNVDNFAGASVKTSSAPSGFIDQSYIQRFRLVNKGMERARDVLIAKLESRCALKDDMKALTPTELVFSQCSEITRSISIIIECAAELVDKCRDRTTCLQAIFGVACEIVSAAQRTIVAEGGAFQLTAFIAKPELRSGLRELIGLVSKLFYELLSDKTTRFETSQELEILGFRKSEKKRLRDLAEIVLKSFMIEIVSAPESALSSINAVKLLEINNGHFMTDSWKINYLDAQMEAVEMLLLVDAPEYAFSLSQEFLFGKGLIRAYLYDTSESMTQRLIDIIAKKGEIIGSASKSLAMEILEDLEVHGLETAPLILRIGASCPIIFEQFLQTRPQIAWLYYIDKRSYAASSISALEYGNEMLTIPEAKTLYSIAKLSSVLVNSKKQQRKVVTDHLEESKSPNVSSKHSWTKKCASNEYRNVIDEEVSLSAHRKLAVIQAQQCIVEYAPQYFQSNSVDRISEDGLVDIIVKATSGLYQDFSVNSEGANCSAQAQIITIGLSLLSMLVGILAAEELQQLFSGLWVNTLTAQQNVWLNLSDRSEFSSNELSIIEKSLFVTVLRLAKLSSRLSGDSMNAAVGQVLPELILSDDYDNEEEAVESRARDSRTFVPLPLSSIIASSKLEYLHYESTASGGGRRNERIAHVIRLAMKISDN